VCFRERSKREKERERVCVCCVELLSHMASMPLGQQQLQPPQVATPPQQLPQAENDPMKVDSRGGSDAASNKVISALGHFLSVRDGAVYGPRIVIDPLDMPPDERSLR